MKTKKYLKPALLLLLILLSSSPSLAQGDKIVGNEIHFTNDDLNAVYSSTAVFKASAANANQTHIDVNFISGATDYERLSKSVAFYKGNDTVQNFHEMYQFYVDSDLITYGLQPRLYADGGDIKVGDVIFFIQKQQQPAI